MQLQMRQLILTEALEDDRQSSAHPDSFVLHVRLCDARYSSLSSTSVLPVPSLSSLQDLPDPFGTANIDYAVPARALDAGAVLVIVDVIRTNTSSSARSVLSAEINVYDYVGVPFCEREISARLMMAPAIGMMPNQSVGVLVLGLSGSLSGNAVRTACAGTVVVRPQRLVCARALSAGSTAYVVVQLHDVGPIPLSQVRVY